ncbi:peptidoglycan DD-metalloendopeptidase family protein [Chishuiella sp.]|uniref:peptidoglycan DD-metalloendopeptidase family protein n=1 Tax=Chishuiella sp. TaxID=1969467 RepID=UPI0028ABDA1D|nr:peptidoglycan DD-metalloendopeptidase family protein [Chishuiella sp.]
MKGVYKDATNERLKELAKYLNKYRKLYKLDTCARKAHFFAQSIQETGSDLESGLRGESFDYYKDNLAAAGLNAFTTDEGKTIAQKYGRKVVKGLVLSETNQIILANYAYGSHYTTGKNFKNTGANDGWNFRGRGLLQITGRSNYKVIQDTINKISSGSGIDIYKKYDNPNNAISIANGYMTMEEAVLTGLADWYKDKMYAQADRTGTMEDNKVVDLIVDIINKHTDSRSIRRNHYQKTKVTFLVDSCKNIFKEEKKSKPNGKWHDPVDNPMCTLYMQSGGGGEAGKHWGLFGKTRNRSNHSGLDLFAKTGTNIYACVDGTVFHRCSHKGYGNTITIKVKDPKAFMKRKLNYILQYKEVGEIEQGKSWTENGDIFLFYAHLDFVNEYTYGQEVKCGDILGATGRSGVVGGTTAPHLHFEIFCKYEMGVGTQHRINPAFFVKYKGYKEQSQDEKKKQEKEKNRGKINEVNGKKSLTHYNQSEFQK